MGNRIFDYKKFNSAIDKYFDGDLIPIYEFLLMDENHYIDESLPPDQEVRRNIYNYVFRGYRLKGDLRRCVVNSLKTGESVGDLYLDKFYAFDLCDNFGRLTERGIIKAITCLPNVKEQVEWVNKRLASAIFIDYVEDERPYSRPIEIFYLNDLEKKGFSVPRSRVYFVEVLSQTFVDIAFQEVVDLGRYSDRVIESYNSFSSPVVDGSVVVTSNHPDDLPYCNSLDEAQKLEFVEFRVHLKRRCLEIIESIDLDCYRSGFLNVVEHTYIFGVEGIEKSDIISDFDRAVSSGSWSALKKLVAAKIKEELLFQGWPDLIAMKDGSISLIEVKSKRDKMRLNQLLAFIKISEGFSDSVSDYILLRNVF